MTQSRLNYEAVAAAMIDATTDTLSGSAFGVGVLTVITPGAVWDLELVTDVPSIPPLSGLAPFYIEASGIFDDPAAAPGAMVQVRSSAGPGTNLRIAVVSAADGFTPAPLACPAVMVRVSRRGVI